MKESIPVYYLTVNGGGSLRFADEDLWLTHDQLAEIYCTTRQNIGKHADNIYEGGELAIYRDRETDLFESDFDRAVKNLKDKNDRI